MKTQHDLVTPKDAAAIMSVSVGTLAKWRSTGHPSIPYVKIGRCVRYRRAELEDYIQKYTINSPSETD